MPEKIIVVFEDTDDGVKKDIRLGEDADTHLNSLELEPSKFVKEVTRKLKKEK